MNPENRWVKKQNNQLYQYENANHSIETKDIMTNPDYLRDVIVKIEKLL